jgi:hypothetical protein
VALKHVKCEGKAFPLQALTGPEGSRRLKLPGFKKIGTWRWQGCQPYAPAAFTPVKYSWYSFLLRVWVDPRAIVRPEGIGQQKFQWHHRESTPRTSGFVAQCLNHCATPFPLPPALKHVKAINTEQYNKLSSVNMFVHRTVPSESRCAVIKIRSATERTIVSKNWIKQLHTLPVLHFNRCFNNWIQWNNSTLQRQLRYWQPILRIVA